MLVNVFTYYENREALKLAAKAARKRPRPRPAPRKAPRKYGVVWHRTWAFRGLLVGMLGGELLWFAQLRQVPPAVLITLLAAWGFLLGSALDWGFFRVRKVAQALRGDRLTRDDLRVLAGR